MRPNAAIVKEIMAYNKNLYVKWDYEHKCFEIWMKRLKGNVLITPVVEAIYKVNGNSFKYEKLDRRIIDWLWSADTLKHAKNWRWLSRKRFNERKAREQQQNKFAFENIAKESYNLVNNECINPLLDVTPWLAPDMHTRGRVSCRSSENAKKYFGGDK